MNASTEKRLDDLERQVGAGDDATVYLSDEQRTRAMAALRDAIGAAEMPLADFVAVVKKTLGGER
jgi:hypothetical protein